MADAKISALTNLTAADPTNDMIPIVDVSDTPPASGNTKRISINNILSSSPTASGALTVTGLVTAGSAAITGAATVGTTLGVTGVSTLASATITGALTVNGSGRFQAAGNWMEFGVNVLTSNQATGANIRAVITSAANPTYSWTGDTDTGLFNDTANTIGFSTGGVERARFNSTGNLAFANGLGIDFSAVTGGTGTATANVLNDYEEGTFTPTVAGTTTAGVGVYTDQNGYYTKIGRLVTVQVFLNWTAHTGTGDMRFSSLPFVSNGSANNSSGISIAYLSSIALTAGNVLYGNIGASVSHVSALQYPTGGGSLTGVPIDVSAYIAFSATYFV